MTTTVSYILAKLLKEKGFNEECFCYYSSTGDLTEPYEENGSSTDTEFRVELSDLLDYHNYQYLSRYAAPIIADVVMWIYEKHRIWISVEININSEWYYSLSNLKDKRNAEINTNLEEYFNSPTKAYTEAITYVLNKLI